VSYVFNDYSCQKGFVIEMTIRILIADDHAMVRKGLRTFLSFDSELEIIGEATDGFEAVALARKLNPDLILMDLLMPNMDGITATIAIRKEMPDVEVVVLTVVLDYGSVSSAIKAGAIGYILKDTHGNELCRMIHAAAAGQVQLSPRAAERLLTEIRMPASKGALTARETDVIKLIAGGKSNKEIALILTLSETTVKSHVSKILLKLNLTSRTQAALYAIQFGVMPFL
jgi:DNA-binding NarL/FixJ family response regulator